MNRTAAIVAAILLATTTAPAVAAVTTFYGIDLASGPGARPNSDAAHADFLAALTPGTIGVEDFNDETVGSIPVNTSIGLEFAGTTTTAELLIQGSFAGSIEAGNTPGLFGSSGTRFLSAASATTLDSAISPPRRRASTAET